MKKLLWFLLVSACFAQTTEVLRPTADVDGGNNLGIGCFGQNQASTAMPKAYDAAGLATFSSLSEGGSQTSSLFKSRSFQSWQTSNNSANYSALVLNVYAFSPGYAANDSGAGNACLYYSTDSGNTWTKMVCDSQNAGAGFGQTFTATLSTSQKFAQLKVATCVSGVKSVNGNPPGEDSIQIYDIWTLGTLPTNTNSGNGSNKGQPHRGVVVVN